MMRFKKLICTFLSLVWVDSTQKRVLLDIVDNATGETASFTAWENIGSVIGSGVTLNGTGVNLNYFGSTGDGVSVIYSSSVEEGTVLKIAEGMEINGYVFPEFVLYLANGKWQTKVTPLRWFTRRLCLIWRRKKV